MLPLWADLAATLVFGLSGALLARSSSLDLVGAVTLAVVAGTGGGIVRDLVLGDTPPVAFEQWSILVAAECRWCSWPSSRRAESVGGTSTSPQTRQGSGS